MSESAGHDWVEIGATLLLAVAAVATAWSSYQANRWNGEQAKAASRTNAIRFEATREAAQADTETEVDVATFIQWVDARASGATELEAFYRQRFRAEFKPAFEAWIATDPLENADAALTPFALPEYRLESETEAARLDKRAEASAATVRRDIQRSSNYVLAVVLFAIALFFGGMSTRLPSRGARTAMLVLGWALFLATVGWIATFPVSLSV